MYPRWEEDKIFSNRYLIVFTQEEREGLCINTVAFVNYNQLLPLAQSNKLEDIFSTANYIEINRNYVTKKKNSVSEMLRLCK